MQIEHVNKHKNRTMMVVCLTFVTMVVEIIFGYLTGSMALLADGWHMLTHVGALGLSWMAYIFYLKHKDNPAFSRGPKKILSLAGYTSAWILFAIAIMILFNSFERILNPIKIIYIDALIVAVIGLLVNLISAIFLHHDNDHHDHNLKAAYVHVITDAFTSLLAIISLTIGYYYKLRLLDPIVGIVGALVIVIWAVSLMKDSGKDLLGYKEIN